MLWSLRRIVFTTAFDVLEKVWYVVVARGTSEVESSCGEGKDLLSKAPTEEEQLLKTTDSETYSRNLRYAYQQRTNFTLEANLLPLKVKEFSV